MEYGADVVGQVSGGRWKPLQYELRRSAFADQLASCNTAGACFVTNSAPHAFVGTVSLSLLNMMDPAGKLIGVANHSISLAAGAGITRWFCATPAVGSAGTAARTIGQDSYARHQDQIPAIQNGFYMNLNSRVNITAECETSCSANASCEGFTQDDKVATRCWLYGSVKSVETRAGVSWYQRPGTAPIPLGPPRPPPRPPSPPPPGPPPGPAPAPRPPPQLPCSTWVSTTAWSRAGCDIAGTNCALLVEVTGAEGDRRSHSTNSFVAPKTMRLPAAVVTAVVGQPMAAGTTVPITMHTTATALYVVLTSAVQGRFSDNAFLLLPGEPMTVDFVSWKAGGMDAAQLAVLKSSLRVEHLQENLGA